MASNATHIRYVQRSCASFAMPAVAALLVRGRLCQQSQLIPRRLRNAVPSAPPPSAALSAGATTARGAGTGPGRDARGRRVHRVGKAGAGAEAGRCVGGGNYLALHQQHDRPVPQLELRRGASAATANGGSSRVMTTDYTFHDYVSARLVFRDGKVANLGDAAGAGQATRSSARARAWSAERNGVRPLLPAVPAAAT